MDMEVGLLLFVAVVLRIVHSVMRNLVDMQRLVLQSESVML